MFATTPEAPFWVFEGSEAHILLESVDVVVRVSDAVSCTAVTAGVNEAIVL